MARMEFKLDRKGVRELLKSEEVLEICREHGRSVEQRAGEGYVMEDRTYPERNGVAIRVDSAKAYYDNLKNNTLLKAVGK